MRFFDNRINYDILITKRKRILSVGGRKVKKMEESFPKAVKVENIANILKVTFENGEVKYVKSHWTEEITARRVVVQRKEKYTRIIKNN